jgi:hypothetical protein
VANSTQCPLVDNFLEFRCRFLRLPGLQISINHENRWDSKVQHTVMGNQPLLLRGPKWFECPSGIVPVEFDDRVNRRQPIEIHDCILRVVSC